jgi:hypothetical protein
MTSYQKAETAGRIKILLLQAVTAIELYDLPLYDEYMDRANELRCYLGDELDNSET